MGADGDADCVEHVWRMIGMTLDTDGTHMDFVCERCPAVMVMGPDQIAGRV